MTTGVSQQPAKAAETRLAHSANRLASSAEQQSDAADRRTQLAADRTVLAAERTYAAWMRTALGALASGIGARTLLAGHVPGWMGDGAAIVLVFFALFCLAAGVWRELDPAAPPPPTDVRRIPTWLLVGFNGFMGVVCVAVLVGLLLG